MTAEASEEPSRRWFSLLFGDHVGAAIFLGGLCFVGLLWRTGIMITDNYAVSNALVNVVHGRLAVEQVHYENAGQLLRTMSSVSIKVDGGEFYAENYGEIFVAAPIAWTLQAASGIVDLKVAIIGVWCSLFAGFADQVGAVMDRRREATLAGTSVAVAVFVLNLVLATDFYTRWSYYLALVALTSVAAAGTGVVLYRLIRRLHGRRQGAVAGALVILATPVGFWATSPMRHTLTAFFGIAMLYWFYRSQTAPDERSALRFRLLAYAPIGFVAWTFAPEGFLLLVALGFADVVVAGERDLRGLVAVGAVVFVSLLPFFVTNTLINGNPIRPPVLMKTVGSVTLVLRDSGVEVVRTTQSAASTASTVTHPWGNGVLGVVASILTKLGGLLGSFLFGFLIHPERVYYTFVHFGHPPGVSAPGRLGVNLAVLEAMPLAGLVAGVPVAVRRASGSLRDRFSGAVGATDAMAAGIVLVFIGFYLPYLPIHAQITMRYLVPTFPLLLYFAFRLPSVRQVFAEQLGTFTWTYVAAILIGSQAVVVAIALLGGGIGAGMAVYPAVGLTTALAVATWSLATSLGRELPRVGAVVLGIAAASTTVFTLTYHVFYSPTVGRLVLPVVDALATAV